MLALLRTTIAVVVVSASIGDVQLAMTNPLQLAWAVLLIVWSYFCAGATYITFGCFDLISYYFRIRFEKVNDSIQEVIDVRGADKDMRSKIVNRILHEHNELCIKIHDYNRFWSKYLFYSYVTFVLITCYAIYQSIFVTSQSMSGKMAMLSMAIEAGLLLTVISLAGSNMSDEVS